MSARDAYRLWAPSYSSETAISHLETQLAAAATPPLEGLRLLDAGCGTARRLRGCGASTAVGVDLSPEMLKAGAERDGGFHDIQTIVGDVRSLPLADQSFDAVWCRLVIGHLPDCAPAYAELARVSVAGARVIVTDFHPLAHAAGHRRTFRDAGVVRAVEHYVHEIPDHVEAARAVGLTLLKRLEAKISVEVRDFYERAGRLESYREHLGLPVVLALTFRREG